MRKNNHDDSYPPEKLVELATSTLRVSFFMISMKLNIYKHLHKKNITLKTFAQHYKMPIASSRAFTQNLCNMGLLVYQNGMLSNSKFADQYLLGDNVTKQLIQWLHAYSPKPEELLSTLTNPPKQPWYSYKDKKNIFSKMFSPPPIDTSFYTKPHALRIRWGEELAAQYPFDRYSCLLDMGGACGGWSVGILHKNKKLRAIIFDQPDVIRTIQPIINTHTDLTNRIELIRGDFFKTRLPNTCDVVLLANILHDWSEKECRAILHNISSSLHSGTTILIREFFFKDDWTHSNYGAHQAMLVLGEDTKSGWQPSYTEMKNLLTTSGYTKIRVQHNLIICTTP